MKSQTFAFKNNRYLRYFSLVILLPGIFLLMGALPDSTTFDQSTSTDVTVQQPATLALFDQEATSDPNFAAFLHIVPNSDGNEITISMEETGKLDGVVYANVGIGPTGSKRGWTMPYSDTKKSHIQTIPFALGAAPIAGSVNITSTQGLASPDVQFNGVAVPARSLNAIWSEDQQVELTPATTTTIPVDTYVVVVTNIGQPGPLPADHQLIGHSYSMRAAGDLIRTPQGMNLVWLLNTPAFAGVDPHTLDIFFWAGEPDGWVPLQAELALEVNRLYTQTDLFGTYAVLAKPAWQAQLATLDSVLATPQQNLAITQINGRSALGLVDQPGSDQAISQRIAPRLGLQRWGTVTFSATLGPPATQLTVDVLDQNQELLLANVSSGQSLAALDPQAHPALHLRANFTATVANATPGLYSWQVTWQPPQPVLLSAGNGHVELGKIITVPLTLASPPGVTVRGITLDAYYDPARLQVVGCQLHLVQGAPGSCNAQYDIDQINPDRVRLSLLTSTTVTTPVTLAELSLRAVGAVVSPTELVLTNIMAVDPAGALLPTLAQTGQITITAAATGDVNCDSTVDRTDVDLMFAYIVQLQLGGPLCPPSTGSIFLPQCDVNRDNVCDLRDVLVIAQ